MLFEGWLQQIDAWLCCYLNLQKESVHPSTTEKHHEKLTIAYTLSFKRHVVKLPWQQLSPTELSQMTSVKQQKLGSAIGQSIAKGLVVSFETPTIRQPDHET